MSAAPNNSVVSVSENIFISSDYDADLFPHRKKHFFLCNAPVICRVWANDKLWFPAVYRR